MKVHHDEGVANRIDPQSCAAAREGNSEALTGSASAKRIALRCEKTAQNYGSFVALALGFILIRIRPRGLAF